MGSITDIKSVLTRKGLDIFCQNFHIPEDLHPQLPSRNQTIHEMPVGKIGVYTRFFEYANFRLPLSTFFVNILRHYRINISQLSVIATAKVSHFEILCRVYNIDPTVGLFHSFPKSTEFNADHYATLVAHPAPFQKFPEPFLCLVGISRYYTLDEETYPRRSETSRLHRKACGFAPAGPARAKSKLEASMDKLFDEGGSAKQGDFAAGGGHDAEIELDVEDTAAENVAVERLKRLRKKRAAATDASGSSHPPKKLRGDHRTSSGAATGGKSSFIIRELLASSVLNVEFGVAAMTTLSLVTSLVSATPEREVDHPTDSMTGANLRTMGPAERFVIPSDSSHHSSTNAPKAEVDSIIRSAVPPSVITEAVVTFTTTGIPSVSIPETSAKINSPIHASMFHDSGSVGTVKPDVAGPSHLPGKELSMGSREVDYENLHEIFVPHWNISNDTLLDDLGTSREFIDHLAPPVLFSLIRNMDYEQVFTEFNIGTARQACLNAEVRMRTEYCLSERKRLESQCESQADLLKARDVEIENLKAQLLLKETEAAEAAHLRGQVSAAEATERIHADEIKALKQRNVALENEKNSLGGKVAELQTSVSTKDLELKDLNAALSSLQSQNDGLVDQVHALEATCSGLQYLTALRAAFSRAIEKGMQSGLVAGIDHIKEGKNLADVAAYNHVAKADFNSTLQKLREVYFSLLTDLKSHKDASVEDIMSLLRLEGPLAAAPGMSDLQPDVEQLRVPIHRSEDQVVLGQISLSFALSVSHSRVEQIRENIAAQRSAIIGVWTPLSETLSVQNLTGEADIPDSVPVSVATTTALSTTFASASFIPPITIEDYEIADTDGQKGDQGSVQGDAQGNAASFVTVEFKKEELDTTPERDPSS
ncbi:hypothetical protein Tco_0384775 [Tanacetum coccineum]